MLGSAGIAPRYFGDVHTGLQKLVTGLNAIPAEGMKSIQSPNLAKLLEVKALAEKLLPKTAAN